MFQPVEAEQGRKIIARWRILAERRVAYLIDLYQSGRWKLYHQEDEFLKMVQEARAALKMWNALAPPDPVRDKAIEIALDRTQDDLPGATDIASANGVAAENDLRKS